MSINKKQEEFWKACEDGNIEIFKKLLVDPDVDPSILTTESIPENRALLSAVRNGHTPIVIALLEDERINPINSNLIKIATENGDNEIITHLIKDTQLTLDDSIVLLLLQDPRTEVTDKMVIKAIKGNCDVEVLRRLLCDPRLTLTPSQSTCLLIKAVETEQTEVIRVFLRELPDETTNYWDALNVAVKNGFVDVVRLFLSDPRVDPSENDSELLILAHQKEHKEIMALLESDPRVDKDVLRKGEIVWEKYFNVNQIRQVLLNFKPEAGVNKQRKFTETVEIQIAFRDYKPNTIDKRLNHTFYVPHKVRNGIKVVIFGNDNDCSEAKKNGLQCYTLDELRSFKKDRKNIRKTFNKKKLVILASAEIIRMIPRIMGPQLNKMGRFPGVLTSGESDKSFNEQVEQAHKKIIYQTRKLPVIHSAIGSVDLTVDQLMENLQVCIIELGNQKLKHGWETVDKIVLKSSMGRPECIYLHSDWFSQKKKENEIPDQ